MVASDLRELLAWLGLEPPRSPAGRLRTSSLASQLALSDGTLRFTDAELRVDASRLTGSLALSLGARPQLAGALALDRLDLDAYWPDGESGELVERALRPFGSARCRARGPDRAPDLARRCACGRSRSTAARSPAS